MAPSPPRGIKEERRKGGRGGPTSERPTLHRPRERCGEQFNWVISSPFEWKEKKEIPDAALTARREEEKRGGGWEKGVCTR